MSCYQFYIKIKFKDKRECIKRKATYAYDQLDEAFDGAVEYTLETIRIKNIPIEDIRTITIIQKGDDYGHLAMDKLNIK